LEHIFVNCDLKDKIKNQSEEGKIKIETLSINLKAEKGARFYLAKTHKSVIF
jgi:hypothetical protein